MLYKTLDRLLVKSRNGQSGRQRLGRCRDQP